MANLKDQVESSGNDLQVLAQKLSSRLGSTILPADCYARWEKLASLESSLVGTIPLFDIRDKAWQMVESLVDPKRIQSEKARQKGPQQTSQTTSHNFSHDGVEMDFASARHLALVSYMSVTWSIYDRLANVCGRLAATEEVSQHQRQNPKLVDFLAGEKPKLDQTDTATQRATQNQPGRSEYGHQLFACSMQYHIRSAYEWPIRVSYTIRNWLVHEGQTIGGLRLFHTDRIEDGLRLHSGAVSHVETECRVKLDPNNDPSRCCLRGADNPWQSGQEKDLLEVIEQYHREVDTMLTGLLEWSVNTFVGQFRAFSARDQAVLSTAVARTNP
jgi:hypothetical protein